MSAFICGCHRDHVLDWIATLAAHIPDKRRASGPVLWLLQQCVAGKKKKAKARRENRDSPDRRAAGIQGIKKRWSTNFSDYGTKMELDVVGGQGGNSVETGRVTKIGSSFPKMSGSERYHLRFQCRRCRK
jgi:hypothetical protein